MENVLDVPVVDLTVVVTSVVDSGVVVTTDVTSLVVDGWPVVDGASVVDTAVVVFSVVLGGPILNRIIFLEYVIYPAIN